PEPKNILIDGFAWTGVEYPASEYGSGTTYSLGAQTRIGDTIYESLQNSNTNHAPATSPTWWRWLGDWVRPVRLEKLTNCTIRGALIRGPFASVDGDGSEKSSLHLDRCRLMYDEADTIITNSDGFWQRTDCTDFNCVPVSNRSNSSLLMRQTWESGTTDYAGLKMEVVDTASSSESKLLDIRVGDSFGELVPTASIDKSGELFVKALEVDGVFFVDFDGDVTMSPANATLDVNGGDIVGAENLSVSNLTITGSIAANQLLASPATASGAPTFRAMATADVPTAARTIQISRPSVR
ncbi:MAG TPA: hypothetical protein PLD59_15710, partial [Tepidisphaeraceae bacterium]|nr:hypothetical protein [Tepidisphaeraceae bacterium]